MDTDRKIKELLKSKVEGFKLPVEDDIWEQIESSIPKNNSPAFFQNRKKWILSISLFLLISVTGFISFRNGSPSLDEDKNEAELPKTHVEDPIDRKTLKNEPAGQEKPDIQSKNVTSTPTISQKVETPAQQSLTASIPNVTLSQEESTETVEKTDSKVNGLELPLFKYEFERLNATPKGLDLPLVGRIEENDKTKKKIEVRFSGQLSLNYLNIRPNVNDQTFLKNVSESLSLSPDHLGLSIRLQTLYPLKSRLWLKNEFYTSVRQHRIEFEYVENAANPELITFDEFKKTFTPLLFGVSAGLEYELNTSGNRKVTADIGMSVESQVNNVIDNERLLGQPKSIWNLNMGFSFYPKSGSKKWVIRPFGYFSLNKKYSEAPVHLTPYGFGIELNR